MIRRLLLVLLVLAAVIGGLGFIKFRQIQAEIAQFSVPQPAPVVTVATVKESRWEPTLESVGTVHAVQGVEVSNQVPGQVQELRFDSGSRVRTGDILLLLDDDIDQADLEGLKAAERLAAVQLKRNSTLLSSKAVSVGDVDTVAAQMEQARALVKAKEAAIDKKVIRAPFDGLLGIRQVDLGQYLKEGTTIVALQSLDPLYVDYALPERDLARLRLGQPVRVRVAAYPDQVFQGSISAIAPAVDKGTRNVQIRARFANPQGHLRPGMFARVETLLPVEARVLTLPREAITYNTYGDSVFLIAEQDGKPRVERRQIATGAVQGDEVAVTHGLTAGDRVVLAGQVKLMNGQEVQIKTADAASTGTGTATGAGTATKDGQGQDAGKPAAPGAAKPGA